MASPRWLQNFAFDSNSPPHAMQANDITDPEIRPPIGQQ